MVGGTGGESVLPGSLPGLRLATGEFQIAIIEVDAWAGNQSSVRHLHYK